MAFSLEYVKSYYKMPFLQRGMKVLADGNAGIVTSGDGKYIRVRRDNEGFSRRYHAQWNMVYFDKDGNVIADYHEKQGEQ